MEESDIEAAAAVYAQGLLLENPPGSKEPQEELTLHMIYFLQDYFRNRDSRRIWVAVKDDNLCGILDFYHREHTFHIRFICGIPTGQGTGTRLMVQLTKYAIEHNIVAISSTVSSLDERAKRFYFQHLGFQSAGLTNQKLEFDLFFVTINPKLLLQHELEST